MNKHRCIRIKVYRNDKGKLSNKGNKGKLGSIKVSKAMYNHIDKDINNDKDK